MVGKREGVNEARADQRIKKFIARIGGARKRPRENGRYGEGRFANGAVGSNFLRADGLTQWGRIASSRFELTHRGLIARADCK